MSDFETVAKVGDIPTGEGRAYAVNGTMVAIFNTDGEYSAINDTCPHAGASLATGNVEENTVYCPWHAWRFCIQKGTWLDNPTGPINVATYSIRVQNGEIQVQVPSETA